MSKGLETLKDIKRTYYDFFTRYDKEQFDIIEKELKALDIIKELPNKYKEGLIYILLNALNERKITNEKYDLLKEVLL